VIKIIYAVRFSAYNQSMRDLNTWLDALSNKPLPGAVSAAAVSAAMGAALIAKAARITMDRRQLDDADRDEVQALWELAGRQQAVLLDLANADEHAYRAVLRSRALPPSDPDRTTAWLHATETPIRVAEACHTLLERASSLLDTCWPAVCPDPEIGIWLLETGARAGLAAAEGNMEYCGDGPEARSLQRRIDALYRP
jgi:formiminotetrahydrofolate cyclodeaminase